MKRTLGSQVPLPSLPSGLFGGINESMLLSNLLKTPKSLKEFPFADVYRRLDALKNMPSPRRSVSVSSNISSQSFKPSEAARALMTQSAITTKKLDEFLDIHYLSGISPSEKLEALDRGLFDLLTASTPNNLRTMMQYLARFWQCGLFGSRPLIRSARHHARYLLQRALVVHPATAHANGGEQVGVPDLQKFETFVNNFFEYLGVQHSPEDELEELLLRLSAKSGTLAAAMSQILSIPHGKVSEETTEQFLVAFAASKPSRKNVEALKGVLLNSQTGPSAVKFLLPYTRTTTELFDLLDVVDRSALRQEVYEQCQALFLDKLLHLSDYNLSLMFALVARCRAELNSGLTSETMNLVLRAALRGTNDSAVYQIIQLGKQNGGGSFDPDLAAEAKARIESISRS